MIYETAELLQPNNGGRSVKRSDYLNDPLGSILKIYTKQLAKNTRRFTFYYYVHDLNNTVVRLLTRVLYFKLFRAILVCYYDTV